MLIRGEEVESLSLVCYVETHVVHNNQPCCNMRCL